MGEGGVEDEVEPVQGGLQVEIVPEAVAQDEGVRAGGLGGWELGAEAGELVGGDGEFDHLFDCRGLRISRGIDVGKREDERLTHDVDGVGVAG